MKYKNLKSNLYYPLKDFKEKTIYKLIMFLYKFTNRHLFESVTINHIHEDWVSCHGSKYYIIYSEPEPCNKCEYTNKLWK